MCICSYVLFGIHGSFSPSPSGLAQLLRPSVQNQTENRGDGGREGAVGGGGRKLKGSGWMGGMVGRKEGSIEKERRPFDI